MTSLEGEVFTPAWSPDSQRLAFISNAGGRFTLQTVSMLGGPPQPVALTGYDYRQPMGRVEVRLVDAKGSETAARIYLKGPDGKQYTPRDGFHRISTITNDHYFHTPGRFTAEVPAGRATIEATKGFEYRPIQKTVEVAANQTVPVTLTLERLADLPARGWHSGDNHIHMNYGGIYDATPKSLMLEADAEDLHVINDLIANNGTRILDEQYFEGKLHALSRPNRLLYFNEEYRPTFPGHMSLLNLKKLIRPFYVGSRGTAFASDYPSNSHILDAAHGQGAIGGYVHPCTLWRRDRTRRSQSISARASSR